MISIVIPTHNRCDLVGRAIDSVLKQTIKDIEIIVVSDGSTDNTEEVVNKYVNSDERVSFVGYTPAKGGNYARNMGIKESKGDYVAFLDDDDTWHPDKLAKQMAVMNSDPEVALVYTGCHIIYVNEKVEYKSIPTKHGNLFHDLLLDNVVGSTSTVLVKKSIFTKSGTFDENLGALQDYDLWIRIARYAKIGVVSEEMINYYNYRGGKQVSALTSKYEQAFDYINKKYESDMTLLSLSDKKVKQQYQYFLLGNKAMRNNDSKTARRYFKDLLGISITKKGLLYYFLTFTSFNFVLKLRSLL